MGLNDQFAVSGAELDGAATKRSTEEMSGGAWLLLASLYSTQYLGLMFFVIALVAILRSQGAGMDMIGLIYMLGLVWPLKLLWAPLIDRTGWGRLGRYRGWLLLTQGGLVVVLLLIGRFDPTADFATVYALCFLVALLASTQDIAVDGLACRLLPASRRGLGNGLQVAGGLVGNLIGGGLMLMVYPHIGWTGCMIALAAATSVSFVQLLWFAEPVWLTDVVTARRLYRRFAGFWSQPGSGYWLALLLLVPIGSSMAYAVITPLLVDAGWSFGRIGFTVNVIGSIVGLLSALATGWAIGRTRRRNALVGAGAIQIVGVVSVMALVLGFGGDVGAGLATALFFVCYNPLATVMATLMMDRASPDSPATDYTLQFSINQFVAIGTMTFSAMLAASFGYLGALWFAAAAALIAMLVAMRYSDPPIDKPDGKLRKPR